MDLRRGPVPASTRAACAAGLLVAASLFPVAAGAQEEAAEAQETAAEAQEAAAEAQAPDGVVKDCEVCPELVVIPDGEFLMGSPAGEGRNEERPLHRVWIEAPLAVGRHEVTFAQWEACVRAEGCRHRPDDERWGRRDRPVVNVSFIDAREYVDWLSKLTGKNYRLLSEAEWEYAARAGEDTVRYWGNDPADACDYENVADYSLRDESLQFERSVEGWNFHLCRDGYGLETAPVGSFEPNPFGLHDMLGNVQEWVEDCWHRGYEGAPSDGRAWERGGNCDYRVVRGGSWGHETQNVYAAARFARHAGEVRDGHIGFRVVRTN